MLADQSGQEIKPGTLLEILNDDGPTEKWVLTGTRPPHRPGASGKVIVRPENDDKEFGERVFYAHVFNLRFKEV
jgi:hypothetical protein